MISQDAKAPLTGESGGCSFGSIVESSTGSALEEREGVIASPSKPVFGRIPIRLRALGHAIGGRSLVKISAHCLFVSTFVHYEKKEIYTSMTLVLFVYIVQLSNNFYLFIINQ